MSLVYLEDYLDTVESLPAELSRNFTLMKELDAMAEDTVKKVEKNISDFMSNMRSMEPEDRVNMLQDISSMFKETLKHGEDKVALAIQTYDMVDRHIRRLDDDLNKFEDEQMTGPRFMGAATGLNRGEDARAGSSQKNKEAPKGEKRTAAVAAQANDTPTKKRKTKHPIDDKAREGTPSGTATPKRPPNGKNGEKEKVKAAKKDGQKKVDVVKAGKDKVNALDLPIDPNEPTYCICNQVSFGEMIACDNEDCPIEWFHYACVGLTGPVKGKWYCPQCQEKKGKK